MNHLMLRPLVENDPRDRAASLAIRVTDLFDTLRAVLPPACILKRDEPFSRRTTLRVGGPADLWVEPDSENSLRVLVELCAQLELPWMVLGRGSNLVVRDGGVRGVVISLAQSAFSAVETHAGRLFAGSGSRLKTIAHTARNAGLGGLEFLEGIPGSLGGALRMNAGAHGRWTFDVVDRLRYMTHEGELREIDGRDVGADYRSCPLLRTGIALAAILRGEPDEPESIRGRMETLNRKRWTSQPNDPSAGCTFKNPSPTLPAGRLIDELGLKGLRVGGAVVSDRHANFLVNEGSASAGDILELIEMVRRRVFESRGIELATEVEIIGEDPE